MRYTKDELTKAVSNIVFNLKKEPISLAKFIIAVRENSFYDWQIFKLEIDKIRREHLKGRTNPIRNRQFKGCSELVKLIKPKPLFSGMINLNKCKNANQQIKLILDTDCSPDIKKEFLNSVKF